MSLPKLTENQSNYVFEYLGLMDKDRSFATEILILIEDRHTTHRDRINDNYIVVILLSGDIVMAR